MPVRKNKLKKAIAQSIQGDGYVDIVKVGVALGLQMIAVDREDSFNSSIEYDSKLQLFKIKVNLNHPKTRQRFSLAREVTHYIEHEEIIKEKGKLFRTRKITKENASLEELANKGATEILIPKELLENRFLVDEIIEFSETLVTDIAYNFVVSKVVAIVRLRELGYYVPYFEFE